MSKAAKPAAAPAGEEKPKSKKMLIIIIAVLVLAIAGGGAFFMMNKGEHHEEEEAAHAPAAQPKFVALEPFTVNLQREEGDQFLQVGVTLKILNPLMEEQIKTNLPEIRSKLILLLSSKRASELASPDGKRTLANEIIEESNGVLGIDKHQEEDEEDNKKKRKKRSSHNEDDGVVDVLFTSFIIQ